VEIEETSPQSTQRAQRGRPREGESRRDFTAEHAEGAESKAEERRKGRRERRKEEQIIN